MAMKQQRPGQPDPQDFASDYASQVAKVIQAAQDERSEKYPLLHGVEGTTIADRSQYYTNVV
jgi:hypothetical protein